MTAKMKVDRRMAYVHLEDDRSKCRRYGRKLMAYGNFKRAMQWFRRHDDLVVLEIARGTYNWRESGSK